MERKRMTPEEWMAMSALERTQLLADEVVKLYAFVHQLAEGIHGNNKTSQNILRIMAGEPIERDFDSLFYIDADGKLQTRK